MATSRQSGFTLIELILVLAISSSLMVIAFIGQRGLRSQASFDASITKVVASIADAHNQATAGINSVGSGNGSQDCTGGSAATNSYVFAGVAWNAADISGGAAFNMDFFKADRTSPGPACIFSSSIINVPSAIQVSNVFPSVPNRTQRILFVRNDTGGMNVCATTGTPVTVLQSFLAGACTAPATGNAVIDLYFSDLDNHSSHVQIDPSGLAKRVN